MFSGIVEEVGEVLEVKDTEGGRWLKIGATAILGDAMLGESISVSGTCLTVVDFALALNGQPGWFAVEAVNETLRRTRCGELARGSKVNLEKALKVSDRLGGHIVTGHIDTVGEVAEIVEDGFSWQISFTLDKSYAPFFVEKGSVAVDGVSLTVAACANPGDSRFGDKFWFSVALIPHTLQVTTMGALKVGSRVNLETDIIARYVIRLAQFGIGSLTAL